MPDIIVRQVTRNIQVYQVGRRGPQGEDGEGIPIGGTSGQILRKASGDDYDTEWATASGTGDMIAATYDPQNIADDSFDRANHTGTQTASTISDFDTEVSNNTDVAANTSARHVAVTVSDSAEIDFTLTGQQITASLKTNSIDESKLDTSTNTSLDLADSSLQPGDNVSELTNDAGYSTGTVDTANSPNANEFARFTDLNTIEGRTVAETKTDLSLNNVDNTSDANKPVSTATQTALDAKQPLDSDLTTIAGLTATTDNFMVATASAWASRTPTQARTQLGLGALATLASVGTTQIDDASVTLAKMADLAQDQFIGRTTASTGVPQTATITSAARTVLDDTTVSAMVDTLGGASSTGSGGLVRATSPTLVTPALGTPSSATLTNATGLPVAGITASTSTALGVGSLELGHATDTTISRLSAGKIAVEGVEVSTATSTLTLTNKRITPRVGTTASSATPTPNADTDDHYTVTALAAGATFGAPTGTPTDGQNLTIRIKDNGTARTLAWNAIYRPITITMPTTTVISKTMYLGMKYNSADTKWDVLAYGLEA